MGLDGPIPQEMTSLKNLEVFKGENNDFTGDFTHLYQIESLQILGLRGNKQLSGSLQGIDGMPYLRELHMSQVAIEGSLDPVASLTHLTTLAASESGLTGAFPNLG